MRPELLFPLFADVSDLPGIGPRIEKALAHLTGKRILDLLWHLPTGFIDRRFSPPVSGMVDGRVATLTVKIIAHKKPPNKRVPYRVICKDETGELPLVFFHGDGGYLRRMLPEGEERIVSGTVEFYNGLPQMTHPDYIVKPDEEDEIPAIEPVYPLTAGVTGKTLQKAIGGAMKRLPEMPEWLDSAYQAQHSWPAWKQALTIAHYPENAAALDPQTPARQRLAYDELLANQLALALVRERSRKRRGRALACGHQLRAKVLRALPFSLTPSQLQAIAEIDGDLAADSAMLRLLQGDVGSGKTIVAFLAMLTAVEAGFQAAFLAPTEILARQHYQGLLPLAGLAGMEIRLLTGRNKGKSRQKILDGLKNGEIQILIGTHALIQQDVAYRDLAFAVVDEQHRFGVYQRLALAEKARIPPDILVMTATPIPRTLTLTLYGDMDVTKIPERPPGRKPIDTRVVTLARLQDVIEGVGRAIGRGERAYWVCPLVEESEVIDLAAAEERHGHLKAYFGDKVGVVHGRMKGPEKDAVMADFMAGRIQILVATTVIEVGVDVPEATIMVIEHAERFGLAQLHQLRGRVGRGDKASTCLLLRSPDISDTARARLKIMRESDDGFRIAEEDLKLRGAGELLGTKQSGFPEFHLADLAVHTDLLRAAWDDARYIIAKDPNLFSERGRALRVLLYLFERDGAVKYLKSG